MKKYLLLILLLWLLPARGNVPEYTYGSMLPLHVPEEAPAWPEGYEPFYVNHTGRHGARFMSSDKKARNLYECLSKAKDAGALSSKGRALLKLTENVLLASQGKWGTLTPLGESQERQIASFTLSCMGESLKKGKATACATYVPRVVMSMYEFCYSLSILTSRLEMTTSEGREFSPLLRFFAVNNSYVDFLQSPALDDLVARSKAQTVPATPARALFTEKYILSDKELRDITYDAYEILQSLPAMEMNENPLKWFTTEEFTACWQQSNYEHWLERTGGYSPVPLKSARILLDKIVNELDAAASGRDAEIKASMHFGHAETLMPLLALMRVPDMCWTSPSSSLPGASTVASHWRDSNVVPLGAFMQVQLARDASGNVYGRIIVNGHITTPPTLWSTLRERLNLNRINN